MSNSICCQFCFTDRNIWKEFESSSQFRTCDFCGASNVNVLPVQQVVELVDKCVPYRYQVTEDDARPDVFDIYDLLVDEENIFSKESFDRQPSLAAVVAKYSGFHGKTLVIKEELWDVQKCIDAWGYFYKFVKGELRFTACEKLLGKANDDQSTIANDVTGNMPKHDFREFWHKFKQSLGDLVTIHDTSYSVHRARLYRGRPIRHDELTAPPPAEARANRMNPTGIPYFYGAVEIDTAASELRPHVGEEIAVGEFQFLKPLRLLNLTKFRLTKSIFDPSWQRKPDDFVYPFLMTVANDISKPIVPMGADIEYVPTQVFCELVRTIKSNPPIAGIRYKSALRSGGNCIALFRGPEISLGPDPWLEYKGYRVTKVQKIDVHCSVHQEFQSA